MRMNIFRLANTSTAIALFAVGILFLFPPQVFSAEDEAEGLEGTVWLIPNQLEMLSIFKVKLDNTVEAGRLGDNEIRWVGTYKNKRLELQNPYYAGTSEYERIEVTVDGSSMTGYHRYKVYTDKLDDPITGYCLNCWVDWTTFGLIGAGGVALLGGVTLLRRWKKKRSAKPAGKKPAPVKKTYPEKKPEKEKEPEKDKKPDEDKKPCAERIAKFLAAVDDYEKHDRAISEILETVHFIEEGWKTVANVHPLIVESENDYQSRLKYLLLLESGEQVTEWGGQALMWFGGLVSGGYSRLMSARAERFAGLAKDAARMGIPASTGVGAAVMEAKAALAGNLSNLATTVGIAAAFVGSLAYFAPGARKNLEKVYQEVLEAQMKLKKFEMQLNILREKLAARTDAVTTRDQNHRFNEILKLKQQMLPDCLDEYQKARDRIGGDRGDFLPPVRGLKSDWREKLEYHWEYTLDVENLKWRSIYEPESLKSHLRFNVDLLDGS